MDKTVPGARELSALASEDARLRGWGGKGCAKPRDFFHLWGIG